MPAGYSGTPLVKKLGIKPGMRVRLVNAPDNYHELLGELPQNVTIARTTRAPLDFIHVFLDRISALERNMPALKNALARDGTLWISWPKKSSDRQRDLDEAHVRRIGLAAGLVDIKICAVDETWSGLKFVYRLMDR